MTAYRVLIASDRQRPEVARAADEFAASLEGKAEVAAAGIRDDAALGAAEADVLVVFGGDGSMLAVARRLGGKPIPVLGVNMGRFGFLTHFGSATIRDDFDAVLSGDMQVARWMMLECVVECRSGDRLERTALNDVVVGSGTVSRVVSVELYVNDEHAATYRGDGVIVSSPAGSTAHSLSAGGPIVCPSIEAFVLTPICPHTLTNRPLVVPPDSRVVLKAGGDACLTLDGQVGRELSEGDEVTVRKAPHPFVVVANRERTYYSLLKDKLHWGRPPAYDKD